ncbi:hypothetical protein [Nocardia sp. CDC160]|uniref:hypothetical protein n=1 Tax=Nocardia sp. CDC160 TaxID=3112166 RepID=UPI002DC062DA|nr:hypothetical protein [Nocardia sp. CDC160]MEC3919382.1 hypothetical protein [Nocardia sp. CDC160]
MPLSNNAADRSERVVDNDGTVEISHVTLRSPLPVEFPSHPEGLDHLTYLRYRLVDGPREAAAADAILLIQPGNYGGPYSLDPLARATLVAAAAKGRTVEFWALARRSEGTQDSTGIEAARAAGDPGIAVDYYFRGKEIGGRVFEGFRGGDAMPYLAELGFAQVVRDTFEVVTRELPDPAVRREKLFIGGHSGGASVMAAFGSWDFDGVPGHEYCKGFIALDTPFDCDFGTRSNPVLRAVSLPVRLVGGALYPLVVAAVRKGLLSTHSGRIVAELFYTMRILAVAAHFTPEREATLLREIRELVATTETGRLWNLVLRANFAPTLWDAIRREPLRYRLTCAAEFGSLVGTGVTVHPLRVAMGSLDGPARARRFPVPAWAWRIPLLRGPLWFALGHKPLTSPADPDHLYGWRNTVGESQSADAAAIARAMMGEQTSMLEPYHATRFQIDQFFALAGIRTGDLAAITHERGMRAKPLVSLFEGHVPLVHYLTFMNLGVAHVFPGYSHVDIVSAAARPDGTPEPISDKLTDFLVAHTAPAVRPRLRAVGSEAPLAEGL